MPTGAGKTHIALMAIKEMGRDLDKWVWSVAFYLLKSGGLAIKVDQQAAMTHAALELRWKLSMFPIEQTVGAQTVELISYVYFHFAFLV